MNPGPRSLVTLVGLLIALSESPGQIRGTITDVLPPDTTIRHGTLTITRWAHPRLTIIEAPDTMQFLYLPQNGASLDSIARREHLRAVINGSFFEGVRGHARHAGWLSLYGNRITPMMDDRQLTHVVRVNGTKHSVEFVRAGSFMPSRDPRLVEFQTGPLIIEDGRIRSDLITASINGSSRHTRSLLATMDHRRCYLIAATERMTLVEVAAALLRVPDFRHGRLDVINLDGGSSVALYVQGTRGLWYNEADHLPILIGF